MTVTLRDLASGEVLPGARLLNFPGGEAHISLEGELPAVAVVDLRGGEGQSILSALVAADALQRRGTKPILFCPYLPAARQDRGAPLSARVYADVLNRAGFEFVVAVDPHSDVMPALVERFVSIPASEIAPRAITASDYVGLVCPDAGAAKRTETVAKALRLPVYYGRKYRDMATGALSGFGCEELPPQGKLLLVDDICDGGGTFRGLISATKLPPERIDLWVSHGVFSGGAASLLDVVGRVMTTDSHPGHANIAATVLSLREHVYPRLREIARERGLVSRASE